MLPGPSEDAEAERDLREGLRNISPETLKMFVLLAVLIQAGLFVGSLGVMLFAFRNQRMLGSGLAGAGVLVLGVSVVLYRRR
jgi:hypothetical protein